MYTEKIVLEVARGDSLEELLRTGVIAHHRFHDQVGPFDAYRIVGGTAVDAVIDGNEITFEGMTKAVNAYGFGHGQRPIYVQKANGCFLVREVFIG